MVVVVVSLCSHLKSVSRHGSSYSIYIKRMVLIILCGFLLQVNEESCLLSFSLLRWKLFVDINPSSPGALRRAFVLSVGFYSSRLNIFLYRFFLLDGLLCTDMTAPASCPCIARPH